MPDPDDLTLEPALSALQDLQAAFDRDRGLDFGAAEHRTFTGLALAGEVGELANALKKAQRAIWLGDDPAAYFVRAAEETGDVLAYLLKLATLLGADLAEVYLTRMSDNCFRFAPRAAGAPGRLITIAGPSGSGKTTIARALSRDHATFVEDIVENPHLDALLAGPEAAPNAYANQRWFLSRVEGFVQTARPEQTTVLDQDPAAIVRAYARMFRDRGQLSVAAYRSLLLDLLRLESSLARWGGGRTVIFLDASAATLRRRSERRGDPVVPPQAWFEAVRGYFAELRAHLPGARVIATDDLDINAMIDGVRRALDASAP